MGIPRRTLGRTGAVVSVLGLGGEGVLRTAGYEDEAYALINAAIDLGVNYCESARAYAGSESYYGKALGERRAGVFLTSKSHARDRRGARAHLQETLKNMKTGFEALREVMVSGYHPSVARLYDPGDGGLHFSHFAEPDDCVLLFMAEGAAGIAKATSEGIAEIVARHPECRPVDSGLIATWFADLVWGPEKITAEDERIRTTRNVNRTTEISADWSTVNDIYESALARILAEIPDITMAGGHSSHSYINGTNMYFNYFYDLVDCSPEEEVTKYYLPIISIICEETLRHGGSIVHHHGIGKARAPWVREEYGSSYFILEKLKDAFDPNGIMNKGTIIP